MGTKRKESVIWGGIAEMMLNKAIRDSSLRRIYPCGKQTVFVDGEEMTFAVFDKKFSLKLKYLEAKGQNVCRKTDFIFK